MNRYKESLACNDSLKFNFNNYLLNRLLDNSVNVPNSPAMLVCANSNDASMMVMNIQNDVRTIIDPLFGFALFVVAEPSVRKLVCKCTERCPKFCYDSVI